MQPELITPDILLLCRLLLEAAEIQNVNTDLHYRIREALAKIPEQERYKELRLLADEAARNHYVDGPLRKHIYMTTAELGMIPNE